MTLLPRHSQVQRPGVSRRKASGFTLAEVLAALVFLAIVIPVVAHGLSIASRAGSSATRRYQAALIAERILNESVVTATWTSSRLSGNDRQANVDYRWSLRNEPWNQDTSAGTIRLLTIDVLYPVQGADHKLTLSTLVDETTITGVTNTISTRF